MQRNSMFMYTLTWRRNRKMTAAVLTFVLLILVFPPLVFSQERYSLNELLKAAVASNPDIEQLVSAANADRAALDGAKASLFPTVKLTDNNTFVGNPQAAYTLAKGALGELPYTTPLGTVAYVPLPTSDTVVVQGGENWLIDVGVQITQPLFTWGKIRNNIALHRHIITVDGLQVQKKRDDVETMIKVDYYSLYYLDKLDSLLLGQKKVADEMLQVAQDSYKAGQINEAELTEKRMAIREITHAIVNVEEQRESVLRNLRFEIGQQDLSPTNVSFEQVDMKLVDRKLPAEQELVRRALGQNNDIRLSTAAEQIRNSAVAVARSGTLLKPDLALAVTLGYSGPRTTDWNIKDDWVANVTLSVTAPLYDGGKSSAAVTEARSRLEQAKYETQSAIRSISKYISETYYELGVAKENIAYYQGRTSDTEELANYKKHLLDIGTGSRVDYLQKRVDVFTEQAHVLEQQIAYATRYFTLQNVTGGF